MRPIRLTRHQLKNVPLVLAAQTLGKWNVDVTDDGLLQEVTDAFNNSLRFDAEDTRMAYTVRDPIAAGRLRILCCHKFVCLL